MMQLNTYVLFSAFPFFIQDAECASDFVAALEIKDEKKPNIICQPDIHVH